MNNVICLSHAHIVIDDESTAPLMDVVSALNTEIFAEVERLAEELRVSLQSEAAQGLVRRTYRVSVSMKEGAVMPSGLFDVRLVAQ